MLSPKLCRSIIPAGLILFDLKLFTLILMAREYFDILILISFNNGVLIYIYTYTLCISPLRASSYVFYNGIHIHLYFYVISCYFNIST